MQRELIATFRAIADDDSVRCVVVRGQGEVFSSGGDIAAFQGMGPEKSHWYATQRGEAMQDAVARLGKPLIAAIDGWCLAGGMELLLMADFAYASRGAKFGVTEIRIGVAAAVGRGHAVAAGGGPAPGARDAVPRRDHRQRRSAAPRA